VFSEPQGVLVRHLVCDRLAKFTRPGECLLFESLTKRYDSSFGVPPLLCLAQKRVEVGSVVLNSRTLRLLHAELKLCSQLGMQELTPLSREEVCHQLIARNNDGRKVRRI